MDEVWKDIEGYDGHYQVSNLGRVRSYKHGKWKIRKLSISKVGYMRLSLSYNNAKKHKSVHRLVAKAFIPNPENKPQINHIDGDKENNCVENLEWCTGSENVRHRYDILGHKSPSGEMNGVSKLTTNQVIEINKLNENGISQREIAKLFNMSYQQISRVCSGECWNHVTGKTYSKKNRRLTPDIVLGIVEMSKNGLRNVEISRRTKVDNSLISMILKGKVWSSVTGIVYQK